MEGSDSRRAQDPVSGNNGENDGSEAVYDNEWDRSPTGSESFRPLVARAREEMKRRAQDGLTRGLADFSDRLADIADRIDRAAERQRVGDGPGTRAADIAGVAAERMFGASDYLREANLDSITADIESYVRNYPVRSVFIAATAGWILGRIVR